MQSSSDKHHQTHVIRRIRQHDNAVVAQIIRTVMTEYGAVGEGYSIEDPEVDDMFGAYSGNRSAFFVIEMNGIIVGCGGIAPLGSETPYALNVDLMTDDVWICGTNSDSLIRYRQDSGEFTVYPLPTQVTYTRDIDFSADGGVWTSNSNFPTWQIETGIPRVIRLDVKGQISPPLVGSNP